MKVAVAARGPTPMDVMDPSFGRCPYFVIFDDQTGQHEYIVNPGAASSSGAAVATVQGLLGAGVAAVVAQNVGPNAMAALQAAGIKVYCSLGGTVGEIIQLFKQGKLQLLNAPTALHHAGLRRGGQSLS